MHNKTDFAAYDTAAMQSLCQYVLSDSKFAASVVSAQNFIDDFDHGILEGHELTKMNSHHLKKLVRFCLPFFEIRQNLESTEIDPKELAAVLLWFLVWRPLDNLLDHDGSAAENAASLMQAFSRAERFQILMFGPAALRSDLSAKANLNAMFETRKSNRSRADLVYMRAIIQETPMAYFREVSDSSLNAFRRYINALGVIHDAMDVLRDAAAKQETPATAALRRAAATTHLCPENYLKFASQISKIALKQFRAIPLQARHPDTLVYKNVNSHYSWFTGTNI